MLQTLISFIRDRAEDPFAVIGAAAIVLTVAVAVFVSVDLRKKTDRPEGEEK